MTDRARTSDSASAEPPESAFKEATDVYEIVMREFWDSEEGRDNDRVAMLDAEERAIRAALRQMWDIAQRPVDGTSRDRLG